jgi:hypothetical protein
MTQLEWLRKLLEDEVQQEAELATADGAETDFFVQNPPIAAGSDTVLLEGLAQVRGVNYTVRDSKAISFAAPPANQMSVLITYERQNFLDAELLGYLEQAGKEYIEDRHIVYRAAIFAIDSLLMGAATSLRFGAGAEDFDLPSVFARLLELRRMFIEWLAEEAEAPAFQLVDTVFDSRDPEFPGGWW